MAGVSFLCRVVAWSIIAFWLLVVAGVFVGVVIR